jgi:hypothetical protein
MATVEERRYEESEEYEEFDMFHTDRDIVKGHITFKFEENKEDAEVPRPLLRGACMQGAMEGSMLGSSDNSC